MEDLIEQLKKIPEVTVISYYNEFGILIGYSVCHLDDREQFYKELKRTE